MKNKLFITLVLCVALFMSLCLFAHASELGYVTDAAGILSAEEVSFLNDQARQVSEYYNCGVYIIVVDNYKNYVNGSIADFSEAIYNSYALGMGANRDGIVLSLSMAERDYDLCAYGDFANYAFTDYGKGKLAETFLDNFRKNDWIGGFNDYIANSISLIDMAKNGNPLDTIVYEQEPEVPGWDSFEIALIVLGSCAVAFAVCSVFKAQMKNTGRRVTAEEYVSFGMNNLRVDENLLLRRDVQRIPIIRDNDSRPSGGHFGGTSVNSGGFSHNSGKF